MAARLRKRPLLAAALIYGIACIAFVSPALAPGRTLSASDHLWSVTPWESSRPDDVKPFGSNFEMLDSALQFQPSWQYTRDELPHIPLWNPYIMGGHTFVGNFQSAIFSPLTVPAYVLPFWDSLAWIAALKLFVAAFGTFLLGRALGMRFGGALLSGVVYAFGLYFVAWLSWPTATVWAWIPWLFLLADLVIRRPGPLPVAGLAAVTAVQFFGGHPESSFHVMFATVVFFALRLWQARRHVPETPVRAPLVAFGIALAAGAALAAVSIGPFLEALLGSDELTERAGSTPDKIPLKYVAGALLADFWGRPTETAIVPFVNNRAFYAGALPLMLALSALVLRPTRERLVIGGLGGVALAVVTGVPPFHQIVNNLPVFTSTHNARLGIFYLLAVALLAGFGLDDLTKRQPTRGEARKVLWPAAAIAALPLVWLAVGRPSPGDVLPALKVAWAFASSPRDFDVIRLSSLIVWLSFAGLSLLLLAARLRGRIGAGAFAGLAVALVACDLFRIGVGLNPSIEEHAAEQPVTPAIEYLQSRRPARFVGTTPQSFGELLPMTPNVAMRYRLYDARGYDFPLEARYTKLWKRSVSDEVGLVPPTRLAPINERSVPALSLLGVADIMIRPDAPALHVRGIELAYDGEDAKVYRNARALPRAFVVSGQRVVEDEDAALDAVTDPTFDGTREAVVERELPGLRTGPGEPGSARITSYEAEEVKIQARSPGAGLLVLTDVHQPGWKVSVDGRDADLERVDYLLEGVRLGPGDHRVEFRYEPASWRLSWILSLASLTGLLAAVGWALARRRRSQAAPMLDR